MDNYYEDTLDLKNLFFYVVKQWRIIIVTALIGCILGCIFSFYKMIDAKPENVLKKLEKVEEINENNIIQYADFVSLYDKELEYSKNSILMNLNSNAVYTGNLSFSYSALDKDIKNIENFYDGLLDNNINQFIELTNNKYEPSYIKELIDFDFITDNSNSIKTSSDVYSSGHLNAIVVGSSEEYVQKVLNKLREMVIEANKKIVSEYSSVTINEDKNNIIFGYNANVSKKQVDRLNSRQSLLNNLATAKSKLNKDELLYYSYHYDYDNTIANQNTYFSKKMPVLFTVAFGILVVGYYFLKYLLDGSLKSFDLIKDKYKLPLLGTLNTNNRDNRGIDKFINNLEQKEFNNLDYLKSSMSLLDGKNIMLCSKYNEVSDELSKLDKRLSVRGSLTNDTKSLDELKKTDGVILVSKLWDTKESDIQRQIDIVYNAGKKILGVIGLE